MKIPSPPESGQREEVVARNQAARKSRPLLDPHGIYGTRTAHRVRSAQRRRRAQSLVTAAAIIAAFCSVAWWARQKRVPSLKGIGHSSIGARPAAFPAWGAVSNPPGAWLVIPTQSGTLVPVEAASGNVGTPFRADFPFAAQPLVSGATAFAPSQDGTLYAVAWQSGRALWNFRGATSISARPVLVRIATPVATQSLQSILVCGDDNGNVVGLNAQNGKVVWKQALHAPVGNGLSAGDATGETSAVIVPLLPGLGTAGGVACLDARNGKILWRVDLGGAILPAPAILANRVFCPGDNGSLVCLDLSNGRVLWKFFAVAARGSSNAVVLRGEPLAQSYSWGTRVFHGGNDGVLRCLDAASGRMAWSFSAGAPIRCRPRALRLPSGGTMREVLLCGSDGDLVFALDAQSGELLWKAQPRGNAYATPGVQSDALVCLTQEGNVERFALPR